MGASSHLTGPIRLLVERGRSVEVFVCETANPKKKWKVSRELASGWAGGGGQPRWRGDGKEIFYIMGQDTIVFCPRRDGGWFQPWRRQEAFYVFEYARQTSRTKPRGCTSTTFTSDGQRFIFVRRVNRP